MNGSCGTVANASACTSDAQCTSGHCVDGLCCNSACGSSCQACDVAGHEGACTTLSAGAKPYGTRAACATGASGCDGTNPACSFTVGAACGTCKACTAAGACQPIGVNAPSQEDVQRQRHWDRAVQRERLERGLRQLHLRNEQSRRSARGMGRALIACAANAERGGCDCGFDVGFPSGEVGVYEVSGNVITTHPQNNSTNAPSKMTFCAGRNTLDVSGYENSYLFDKAPVRTST